MAISQLLASYFSVSSFGNGTLTVPANGGVFKYGTTSAFPNQSYDNSNYWVDVVVSSVNSEQVLSTNSPLTVAEGATGAINAAQLTTPDALNAPAQWVYTITSGPTHGTLKRSGSATNSFTQADVNAGLITYQHDGSETTSDSFAFTADDGQGTSSNSTFNIVVMPVNDEQVLTTNSPLTVAEGATGAINAARLTTTDVDNTPAQLVYTITSGPTSGTLKRSGSATNSFTQADINAGLITYQHNGSETTSDSFAFTVNDGQGTSTSATFNIVVTPVNDEQVLTTNSPLTVAEGATGTISAARLTTTDVDNTPAQLVYTITSGPTTRHAQTFRVGHDQLHAGRHQRWPSHLPA